MRSATLRSVTSASKVVSALRCAWFPPRERPAFDPRRAPAVTDAPPESAVTGVPDAPRSAPGAGRCVRMPSRARRRCVALPTPQIRPTGFGARNVERLGPADDREAARLVEVGGDLGQELVVAEADRDGDAELALDPARQAGSASRRAAAMQAPRCRKGRGTLRRSTAARPAASVVQHERADLRARPRHISPCRGRSRPRRGRASAP